MLTTQWGRRPASLSWTSKAIQHLDRHSRAVSRLGAINKGLRASREAKKPVRTSTSRQVPNFKEGIRPVSRSRDAPSDAVRGRSRPGSINRSGNAARTWYGGGKLTSAQQWGSRASKEGSRPGESARKSEPGKLFNLSGNKKGAPESTRPGYDGRRETPSLVDRKRTSKGPPSRVSATNDGGRRRDQSANDGERQASRFTDRKTAFRSPARGNSHRPFDDEHPPKKSFQRGDNFKPGKGRESPKDRNRERGPDDSALALTEPYATAASQFLYGTNTVRAALMAKRRQLYKLYVLKGAAEDAASEEREKILKVNDQRKGSVPVKYLSDVRVLDVMAAGRQHNGVVLDAAPLPVAPVQFLRGGDRGGSVEMVLQPQSPEEAKVNSAATSEWKVSKDRCALVVLLDGILDEGNLGGILRSAFLLGVDAVAVCTATCAPLNSGIVAKASSGACEGVRLLTVSRPSDFCTASAKLGWRLWGTGMPVKGMKMKKLKSDRASEGYLDQPTILMMGGEGRGLSESLMKKAHELVYIEPMLGQQTSKLGVDSFNVSVASALLMDHVLRSSWRG